MDTRVLKFRFQIAAILIGATALGCVLAASIVYFAKNVVPLIPYCIGW